MTSLRGKFGKRVRELRRAKGWTQEQLADKAGMEYKYLGAIERGKKNVTIDNIDKIRKGLGVDVYQLFLFGVKGLKPRQEITEEKLKDILKLCDAKSKQFLLNIMQGFMELRSK